MASIPEAIKMPSCTDHCVNGDLAYWLVGILVSKEFKPKHKRKDSLF